MRMWMVNPRVLCRNHLLGEHNECHMLAGCLILGRSLAGYLEKEVLEPQNLTARHDQLVEEMLRRGYRHESPLPEGLNRVVLPTGKVDAVRSMRELRERCEECADRLKALTGTRPPG